MKSCRTIPMLLFIAFVSLLNAQKSIDWQVIPSQGGTDQNSNVQIQWTLGESAISSAVFSNFRINEGFQQATLRTVKISRHDEISNAGSDILADIFPNPTSGILNIDVSKSNSVLLHIRLSDPLGKLCAEKQLWAPSATSIDMSALPSGIYLLRLYTDNTTWDEVYKVIKQ